MSNRVSCLDQGVDFEIRIAMRRHWFMLLFLPLWLAGWTVGGVAAFKAIFSEGFSADKWFLVVWLVGWIFGEFFAAYVWLWHAFGKEIVRVGSGILAIKRDILGLGPVRSFQTMEISDLRAAGYFGNTRSWSSGMAQWGISGGTVAFDYRAKTRRFGIQLEEREAREVVERLRPHLPERASPEPA